MLVVQILVSAPVQTSEIRPTKSFFRAASDHESLLHPLKCVMCHSIRSCRKKKEEKVSASVQKSQFSWAHNKIEIVENVSHVI